MAYFEWDEKYSVKVPTVDNEHKKLFELINGFYAAIANKGANSALLELVEGLRAYTVYHFTHEEKMMQQARYGGLATQQAAHKSFVDKVTDIQKRIQDGKLVVSMEMTSFLKSWLTEHILKLDTKYSESMMAASIR